MNCRRARRLMDDVLDGNTEDRAQLEGHLQACTRCRLEWSRLEQVAGALNARAVRPVDEARLNRLAERVSAVVRAQPVATRPPARPRAWTIAAVGAAAITFVLGLGAGRSVWPRQVVVTKTVTTRKVVKEPVEVPVPVPTVEERVVEKPVPVYRTRVVYRDRLVEVDETVRQPEGPGEAPTPPARDLVASPPVVWREIAPASLAVQGAKPLPPPGPPEPTEPSDLQGEQRSDAPSAVVIARTDPGGR